MGKSNIIEINGRRYDVVTGRPLGGATDEPPLSTTPTFPPPDDPQPKTRRVPVQTVQVQPRAVAKPTTKAKTRVHDAIRAPKHPASHKQQHSKTLMRSAVKKPGQSLKRRAKTQGHLDTLAEKPAARLTAKPSVHRLNSRRLEHAKRTPKSQAVNRFSKVAGLTPQPPTQVPATVHQAKQPHVTAAAANKHAAKVKQPAGPADLLERALQAATSHEQTFAPAKKRRRPSPLASLSMAAAALVLLIGFVVYQNINSVKINIASSKAGFSAGLPGYQPDGYHLSHINAAPGTVAINYRSNTDSRSYAITEKASHWDSNTLRDSFLASSGQDYQTVESAGRTLFLYGQNAATWVNDGIWYQVQGSGALSNQQLMQLARSL